jgi:hypothetical protein
VDTQDLRNAQWHISTYSANGSTCVEVARNLPSLVAVRDSKDRQGSALTVTHQAWSAFIDSIKHGELGL